MQAKDIYIVDLIGEVVDKVSIVLTEQLQLIDSTITGVHYEYGHHNDIKRKLIEKTKSNEYKFSRYPLIALFQDFPETWDKNGVCSVKLQLIIGFHSTKDFYSDDRYLKVFKPILYPIYKEFKKQLSNHSAFTIKEPEQIVHEKIDRPHWGDIAAYGTSSYIFGDVLDAVEIRGLELTVDPEY